MKLDLSACRMLAHPSLSSPFNFVIIPDISAYKDVDSKPAPLKEGRGGNYVARCGSWTDGAMNGPISGIIRDLKRLMGAWQTRFENAFNSQDAFSMLSPVAPAKTLCLICTKLCVTTQEVVLIQYLAVANCRVYNFFAYICITFRTFFNHALLFRRMKQTACSPIAFN